MTIALIRMKKQPSPEETGTGGHPFTSIGKSIETTNAKKYEQAKR